MNILTSKFVLDDNEVYTSIINTQNGFSPDNHNHAFNYLEQNSFWFKFRNKYIETVINKYAAHNNLLDIGGGNGFVSLGLQNTGINVTLIEPGYQGCVNAIKRGVENVIYSTIEDCGFEENSIESVGLFDVLEHIEEDKGFLLNMNHLMKDDSYIFITVPAYKFLWSNDDIVGGHYKRHTIKSLNRLLKETGFSKVYATYFFSFLVLPIFLFRTLPYIFKITSPKKDVKVEKYTKEHKNRKGLMGLLLELLFKIEYKLILKTKTIIFGGSILFVAQKINNIK
jgi:2-polyprenyl-3-methyl-5-hydroxy-6-metoxy-1,4-benzoquinol methylase